MSETITEEEFKKSMLIRQMVSDLIDEISDLNSKTKKEEIDHAIKRLKDAKDFS